MKIEKVEKVVANLHAKKEGVIQIRNLREAQHLGFAFKKSAQIYIKFNQEVWLKP